MANGQSRKKHAIASKPLLLQYNTSGYDRCCLEFPITASRAVLSMSYCIRHARPFNDIAASSDKHRIDIRLVVDGI